MYDLNVEKSQINFMNLKNEASKRKNMKDHPDQSKIQPLNDHKWAVHPRPLIYLFDKIQKWFSFGKICLFLRENK